MIKESYLQLKFTIKERMRSLGAKFTDKDGFFYHDSKVKEPDFHLRGMLIYEHADLSELEDIIKTFKNDTRKNWSIRIDNKIADEYEDFLKEFNFFKKSWQAPIMTLDLSKRRLSIADTALARVVTDLRDLKNCAKISSSCFDLSLDSAKKLYLPYKNAIKEVIVIEIDKKTVACGTLIKNPISDYCGLYYIGTDEHFRSMGVGKILVEKLIERAKYHNSKFLTLQASEPGMYLYKKFGFETVTKFSNYYSF